MKPSILLLALALPLGGCFSYRNETPRVTRETVVSGPTVTRTVTVLPSGYRSRTYRGVTYYEQGGIYYRDVPGGYTVVERPW